MSHDPRRCVPLLLAWLLTSATVVAAQITWLDPSPHAPRLVRVEPDVEIEVLDWGGSGRTVVLLAQLGQTAHIYDDWAPTLTRAYHVLAITRRGYGRSSAPAAGYAIDRLAADVVAVLDAMAARTPVLVGNGFAGEEMSRIASRYPNRAAGLVYLNAAYDRSDIATEAAITRRIPPRPPTPQDMASVQALTRWASGGMGFPIPEAEFRQLAQLAPDGRVIGQRTPPAIQQQILSGMAKADYASIRVPALIVYAPPTSADSFPGCRGTTDAGVRQACEEQYAWTVTQLDASRTMVRAMRSTQIVELRGAHAFVFLSNPRDVAQAMDAFVAGLAR